MIVDENIAELICTLEYKIGNQTYNPNSYNGWTGEEGCGFKYPVSYCKNKIDLEEHKITKTKSKIEFIDPECIETMKYAFGSNHLYIGDGIVKVLNYLEELYDIDFNKLEQQRIAHKYNALALIEEKLMHGEIVRISSGKNRVGLDIPEGIYKAINLKEGYSSYLSIDIYNTEGVLENYIRTDGDEIEIELKNGYYTKSFYPYLLKNCAHTSAKVDK